MDVVVVVDMIDGLEESFDLSNRPAMDREKKHHPRQGVTCRTHIKRQVLHPSPSIAPAGAAKLDLRIIQLSRLIGTRNVLNELLAFRGLCPGNSRYGIFDV